MAYLVVSFKGSELGRRTLRGPIVIGRAAECDLMVRDILLSRRHCRIEARGRDWVVTDLGSKNGTFVRTPNTPRRVAQHLLRNGETLQIGKTSVTYHSGKLNGVETDWQAHRRPGNPNEAMSATVAGHVYRRPVRLIHLDRELPVPRPAPRDPIAYDREGVHAMVNELVSSSWDSIYAGASMQPRPERAPPRPVIMIDISKQAILDSHPPAPLVSASTTTNVPVPAARGNRFTWPARLLKTMIRFGIVGLWVTLLAYQFRH